MSSAFSFIFALLKAMPIAKEWIDKFVAFYIAREIEKMHEADRKAIRKAIDEQDQRDLEKQMFNMEPGRHSGLPNTELRSTLPGVQDSKKGRDTSDTLAK